MGGKDQNSTILYNYGQKSHCCIMVLGMEAVRVLLCSFVESCHFQACDWWLLLISLFLFVIQLLLNVQEVATRKQPFDCAN